MRTAFALFTLVIATSVCGCGTSWSFHGSRGENFRPAVTSAAMRIYSGDIETVKQAPGAVILGEMQVDSSIFSGWGGLRERASLEAAKLGGTHYTLLTQWTQTQYSVPHAIYVVIRVPPDSWEALPEELRPAAI